MPGAAAVLVCLCLCLLAGGGEAINKIEAPCTACKAVARELQHRIDNEKERQPVDLRHRLDQTGKRYGKVIDYKNSELRAIELLDGLCNGLKSDWSLVTVNSTDGSKRTRHWAKKSGHSADDLTNVTRPSSSEEDVLGKRLESYCGSVVEDLEEEIMEGIMRGGFDTDGVEAHLCRRIITPCPSKLQPLTEEGRVVADKEADGTKEEL